MAKADLKEVGSVLLGAAVGAAVSRYGSDAISNALTKKERTPGDAAEITQSDLDNGTKKVAFYKKAYTWDLALGLAAGAAGVYAKGMSSQMKLGLQSSGAYLVANGLLDMVGDLTTKAGEKHSYNGRPQSKTVTGFTNPGAMSRSMAYAQARPQQSFSPRMAVSGSGCSERDRLALY